MYRLTILRNTEKERTFFKLARSDKYKSVGDIYKKGGRSSPFPLVANVYIL